jgi:hypothetical protein
MDYRYDLLGRLQARYWHDSIHFQPARQETEIPSWRLQIELLQAVDQYNRMHRTGCQHIGPITRTMRRVAIELVRFLPRPVYPSLEALAAAAGCARSTAALALRVLRLIGLVDWARRLKTIRVPNPLLGGVDLVTCQTSNLYVFAEPYRPLAAGSSLLWWKPVAFDRTKFSDATPRRFFKREAACR